MRNSRIRTAYSYYLPVISNFFHPNRTTPTLKQFSQDQNWKSALFSAIAARLCARALLRSTCRKTAKEKEKRATSWGSHSLTPDVQIYRHSHQGKCRNHHSISISIPSSAKGTGTHTRSHILSCFSDQF